MRQKVYIVIATENDSHENNIHKDELHTQKAPD